MAYRDGLDALRERYLALVAERDETPTPSRRHRELEREIEAVAISIDARTPSAPGPVPAPTRRRLLLSVAIAVPAIVASLLVVNEFTRPPPIPASDPSCNDCSCRPFPTAQKTPLERWLRL